MSSISGLGRSPGGGQGNPLQYSCLENPIDGGAHSFSEFSTAHLSGLPACSEIRCIEFGSKFSSHQKEATLGLPWCSNS